LKKFLFLKLFIIFSLFTSLYSCKKEHTISENDFTIRDDLGIVVNLDSPPQRILSLAPNITEALFAIGAGEKIVGVTTFCDYPPEANEKTKTGGLLDPDYETIVSLNPDLVIMTVEGNSQPAYKNLEKLGMKIFVANPKSLEGIFKMIEDFGKITGNENEADDLVQKMMSEKINYVDSLKYISQKTCLLLIAINPLMTASGKTYLNDIIELAGFDNIYKGEAMEYPNINNEDLLSKDPDYIILPIDTNNTFRINQYKSELNSRFRDLKAVKDSNIILLDENILFRPGPRVLQGIKIIKDKANK
jgi:iron complex transport system substrate-binding protein